VTKKHRTPRDPDRPGRPLAHRPPRRRPRRGRRPPQRGPATRLWPVHCPPCGQGAGREEATPREERRCVHLGPCRFWSGQEDV